MPLLIWPAIAIFLGGAILGGTVDNAVNPHHEDSFGFNQHTLFLIGMALIIYFMAKKAWKELA